MEKKRSINKTICVLIIIAVAIISLKVIYPKVRRQYQFWNYRNRKIKEFSLYRYSEELQQIAEAGLALFYEGKTITSFRDGYYTDPIENTKGYECWTNGRVIKIDRNSDGHYETFFNVADDNSVVYVGSIGAYGRYVDVGTGFEYMLGKRTDEAKPAPALK